MRVAVGELTLELTADQVEDLRSQLGGKAVSGGNSLLTTAQAAERLNVSTDFMREHATELGGTKLTDSPRAPWRFDPAKLGADGSAPKALQPVTLRRRAPRRAGPGRILKARG